MRALRRRVTGARGREGAAEAGEWGLCGRSGILRGTPFFSPFLLRPGGSRTPQRRGSRRRGLVGRGSGCGGAGPRGEAARERDPHPALGE